jgi:hypothetical protein
MILFRVKYDGTSQRPIPDAQFLMLNSWCSIPDFSRPIEAGSLPAICDTQHHKLSGCRGLSVGLAGVTDPTVRACIHVHSYAGSPSKRTKLKAQPTTVQHP